mmetsp:Transcript_23897/g.44663  ORF Transcript_23897/g.44663 Transcript_23897/m.44663 type:complete len:89 (-) Transcript_23897:1136-1402(-)
MEGANSGLPRKLINTLSDGVTTAAGELKTLFNEHKVMHGEIEKLKVQLERTYLKEMISPSVHPHHDQTERCEVCVLCNARSSAATERF